MEHFLRTGKKVFSALFNTRAAGIYILLFAAAIGVATFIENDFGTSSAQKVIFKAWWFELLLVMFGISILVNIFKFRMIQQKKWTLLIFHAAIIIIILGAGVTRYFGYEGIMHIRENETSNKFLSSESFLKFHINHNGKNFDFDEPVLFATLGKNNWSESYLIENNLVEISVKDFMANPEQKLTESLDGKPTLMVVISGANGREEYFLSQGEIKKIGNLLYNFTDEAVPNAFNIQLREGSLFFKSDQTFSQMIMATQERDTIASDGSFHPLYLRSLYSDGANNVVFAEFKPNGKVVVESNDPKVARGSLAALIMDVSVNGNTQETMVYGMQGIEGSPTLLTYPEFDLSISYGAKEITLPFAIKLYKFIMERYPGTNSASSYASEVRLIDESENVEYDFRIYMNNILNYDGYRFFQSSFDRDERGTYLSVNHDFWGTIISYIGYGLLTLGMGAVFFSRRTRFHQVMDKLKQLREKKAVAGVLILFLLSIATAQAQNQKDPGEHLQHTSVDPDHAEQFSRLIAQDFNGRMKPMHTLSREILRKVSRKESWFGLNADQIILSMFANTQDWYGAEIIKLGKHKDVLKLIDVSGNYAAFRDFFHQDGQYKLREEIRRVHSLDQIDRGTYEKELLKIDERVNILNMVFSGTIFKLVPNPEDPANTWMANHSHGHDHQHENETLAERFFKSYRNSLAAAINSRDYSEANHLLTELEDYQRENGQKILPSDTQLNAEIFLNDFNVFNRLVGLYFLLGLALLFLLFTSVFKPNLKLNTIHKVLLGLVLFGFAMHTIGLGVRWYVSERAPWSNGYESMIYIAWTSTLAGILFTRKSIGGLAATMVLAGTILFVATLSFLDPEITPLVPVLKSYWLTIHVSMEAGSYGFLMLGAIIGLINLILMIFVKNNNHGRIKKMIQEMSYLSELTLIGGLFMVSIGTYLGGVWANESWGRYWGWDAKETWALVTILIYAFILHMRIIPKMTGLYAYNLATVFGLASVIMTYYGVNYYLSGLHSYATGDPVPIPTWVYVVVASIIVVSLLAFWRKKNYIT